MSTHTPPPKSPFAAIQYPDSDGKPMADNTLQHRWIVTILAGLDSLFSHRPDVFVAADLLWYPVEGDNKLRMAPDVMVAFGRPQGDRGSYMQWVEDGIAPQVVFEILSPGNRPAEMSRKRGFYERYGVEEYYVYDPEPGRVSLRGWLRDGLVLRPINTMKGWTSPRLGVRFDLSNELELYHPDGEPFLRVREIDRQRREFRQGMRREQIRAEEERVLAEEERARAAEERARAAEERARADEADARAAEERVQAEKERARSARLMAKLRELGIDPADLE